MAGHALRTLETGVSRRVRALVSAARRVGYTAYYRVRGLNYRLRLAAPRKHVRSRSYRSYEPFAVHRNDPLLDALLDRCASGDVVWDVGANTGVYALAIAAEYPDCRVIAIEPDPRSVARLRANVALNGFEDRVDVLPIGLGAESHAARFYRSSFHELSSFNQFNAARWGARVIDAEEVRVEPLDALVGEYPAPDHLKIDVEGFGREVLRGASAALADGRPTVYVESHATGPGEGEETADAMRSILAARGYAIDGSDGAWICRPTEPEGGR